MTFVPALEPPAGWRRNVIGADESAGLLSVLAILSDPAPQLVPILLVVVVLSNIVTRL